MFLAKNCNKIKEIEGEINKHYVNLFVNANRKHSNSFSINNKKRKSKEKAQPGIDAYFEAKSLSLRSEITKIRRS